MGAKHGIITMLCYSTNIVNSNRILVRVGHVITLADSHVCYMENLIHRELFSFGYSW
jgi:hypothetical protein